MFVKKNSFEALLKSLDEFRTRTWWRLGTAEDDIGKIKEGLDGLQEVRNEDAEILYLLLEHLGLEVEHYEAGYRLVELADDTD